MGQIANEAVVKWFYRWKENQKAAKENKSAEKQAAENREKKDKRS